MKLRFLAALLLSLTSLVAGEIRIAVAANVSYAIPDLIRAFNRIYPDTRVKVLLGSSGKLTAQIQNGAPFELFMSADMKYPQTLYAKGVAVTRPLVYAQGSLALFTTKPLDLRAGISLLKDVQIRRIAIANPKTAPYGKAAVEALRKRGLYDALTKKFIYGESVSQTVTYAVTAADIGLVAKSALYAPKMAHYREGVHWRSVDPGLYKPIDQGIVILQKGIKSKEAAAFFAFVFSREAENIFKRFGYIVP